MSKSYTEKFMDGSFECGAYYCVVREDAEEDIKMLLLYHDGYGHGYAQKFGSECDYPYENIVKVLEPVPSYKKALKYKKQIKEANKIIKGFMNLYEVYPSGVQILNVVKPAILEKYIKKWNIKRN